jgi:glycosyltransferase involved in cell wall biosynthesis
VKILGISNPQFSGVTVATKAVVSDYAPIAHIDDYMKPAQVAESILRWNPEVLVVGGWSRGYAEILKKLKPHRRFPVVCIYHSTVYHGKAFNDDKMLTEVKGCLGYETLDFLAYVDPRQVQFDRKIDPTSRSLWLPHSFKPRQQPIAAHKLFRIGILGGTASVLKNSEGAITVANSYAANRDNVQVVYAAGYNKSHKDFLDTISNCSVILHPSHLECYSNLLQEAWSYGVPVIFGTANTGLTESPLLTDIERSTLNKLCLKSVTDPSELYDKISLVHQTWQARSNEVKLIQADIHKRTDLYLTRAFAEIAKAHAQRSKYPAYFDKPFAESGLGWLK